MIEYLILLLLAHYRGEFSIPEKEASGTGLNGPYAGLFIDEEPEDQRQRERPNLRIVK